MSIGIQTIREGAFEEEVLLTQPFTETGSFPCTFMFKKTLLNDPSFKERLAKELAISDNALMTTASGYIIGRIFLKAEGVPENAMVQILTYAYGVSELGVF